MRMGESHHLAKARVPSSSLILDASQPAGPNWYVNVLAPLVKVSERFFPVQLYEASSGDGVTGLVTPATVIVPLSVTFVTWKVPECAVVFGEKP